MRYRVTHRTTYTYDDDVTDSLAVAHLTPRSLPWQVVHAAQVDVDPAPEDRRADLDAFGNGTVFLQVTTPHRVLTVIGRSEVEVQPSAADQADAVALSVPWEQARPALRPDLPGAWRAVDLTLASPLVDLVPAATAYAALSLTPGRPLGEAVDDLVHRIHADLAYDPRATTVTSRIEEVLDQRAGVCQDFAQLMVAGLRGHGLAARYVSGYLSTTPPPGRDRVVGADASHAWVQVWVPRPDLPDGPGDPRSWLAVDPTNDARVGERHVTVAWGRDYGDVPPLKGVIVTEAESSRLEVSVDVEPLPGGGDVSGSADPGTGAP
ncbi:transglutaminase family protein [Lapillicoccus jejuensis]|uniref:Transglutaminase-like putative cysteine protease n=1 Tax=Lapillicoccus jejuensis TaxID=402171 RepID=A0A542DYT5_9MICO|nr:transglutaminase family protein [Lapillicoccus jejuensis]TQJ08262.1 transglutaminase-like putative cysteine protease [Lapillicoccus jejuensis]